MRAVLRRKAPHALDAVVELVAACAWTCRPRLASRSTAAAQRLELRLGPTEFRLLHFLMAHPERVHSRRQLLDRVWGDHVFIAERTVDVSSKRLLRDAQIDPAERASDGDRCARLPHQRTGAAAPA